MNKNNILTHECINGENNENNVINSENNDFKNNNENK